MKKITFLILAIAVAGLYSKTFAQAKKHVLFEQFTNAGCAPCAQQNPGFYTNIINPGYSYIKHCQYHVNWPGSDPMNSYNTTENSARTSYYGVSSVPTMIMQGNKFKGPTGNVTLQMAKDEAVIPSPLSVKVKETTNGNTRNVTVTVYTLSPVSAGTYKVRTAVVESIKTYTTAPGSNGEKTFKNVFRKMLPNTTGSAFTPASTYGDSTVFTYSYTLDVANWDPAKIYTVAWVQNETSKEVINCGSSIDPDLQWWAVCTEQPVQATTPAVAADFNPTIYNLINSSITLKIKITKNQPSDWTATLLANSASITDSSNIIVAPGNNIALQLSVVPGNTSYIGEYKITVTNLSDATTLPLSFTYLVNSGITDLVINNDVAWGDAGTTYSTSSFQSSYTGGLTFAGEQNFATTKLSTFLNIFNLNKLGTIKHLYFNVGWSFPSLTSASVAAFQSVLNNGGNLFISGQDIGWDTWDVANGGNGNSTTQSFYTNYLKAGFVDDGSTANSSITVSDATDLVFGSVATSAIANVYGSTYFYPDQINAATGGKAIFKYPGSLTAAVRSTAGNYKTVYLGFSLEQVSNATVKQTIMKQAHDWFHGLLTSVEFDNAVQQALGQNYPNPADNSTVIELPETTSDLTLQISDITGRIIYSQTVSKDASNVVLNTSGFRAGLYNYRFVDGGNNPGASKLLQVVH